ncbi:MAG: hypothetical protein AAFV80_15625 [Bacteroidota bacterium]
MIFALQITLFLAVLFLLAALPRFIWAASPFFLAMNQAQWYVQYPFRGIFKDPRSSWPRRWYFIGSPVWIAWFVLAYLALLPVRFLNALYFDVLLFWSVNLRDQMADLWNPKRQGFRFKKSWSYYRGWLWNFPFRLGRSLLRSMGILLQGLAMLLFDLIWPSLTLFHGTTFQGASIPITQSGQWKVGYEDFVGTGIYFAIAPSVAVHYASHHQPCIVLARVTLSILRPVSTLRKAVRRKAGHGGGGDLISKNAGLGIGALEHWRHDRGGWWEYCLVFPGQKGKFIHTWRIRPICVLPVDKKQKTFSFPQRIWKGIALWPHTKMDWGIFTVTLLVFLLSVLLIAGKGEVQEGVQLLFRF